MSETQVGSCEPCKKKKCKCDRKVPSCGQCACLPSMCKYAENNKRGIPSGYLSALEQRLNETESALYDALSELRSMKSQGHLSLQPEQSVLDSSRVAKLTKTSRMAEWKHYPLKDSRDKENWWQELGRHNGSDQGISRTESPTDFEAGRNTAFASREASSQHLEPSGFRDNMSTAPIKPTPRFPPSHNAFEIPEHSAHLDVDRDPYRSAAGLPLPNRDPSGNNSSLQTDPNGVEVQNSSGSIRAQDFNPQVRAWEVGQPSEPSARAQMAAPPARTVAPEAHLNRSQHLSKAMQDMYY